MQVRLYFPLLISRQLITGVSTAYAQEINKLRKFGITYITPHLARAQYRAYPFDINFTFYTASETDMISVLTTASYIIHLFENNATIQSTDYRVIPHVNIEIKKTHKYENEGCEIKIERHLRKENQ